MKTTTLQTLNYNLNANPSTKNIEKFWIGIIVKLGETCTREKSKPHLDKYKVNTIKIKSKITIQDYAYLNILLHTINTHKQVVKNHKY